ncbi:MAG: biotin transporter BioY [Bdellovibrionaceae bacterium]|nr:biotin transporter BioY [Pseudobdellovibrionaceae bacterium]
MNQKQVRVSEQALVPQILLARGNRTIENVVSVFLGVMVLSVLAQIAIPLPWTPVPVTGQTFGVAFMSLLWGRRRGLAVVLSYIALGAFGLPVFALGKSGFMFGPTMGYLVGMVVASYWMGLLSDWGWTKTFFRSYLAAASGSLITFCFGALVLSTFVPSGTWFIAGVLPFIPGDIIKTLVASYLAYQTQKKMTVTN